MATITPTITYPDDDDRSCVQMIFTPMTFSGSDVSAAIKAPQFADRSVQVYGTFGAAGNLRVEGSNDGGTTWATLADPQGNALDITAAKIEQLLELTAQIRFRVTAGDGTTSLTVAFFGRRQTPPRT